MAAPKKYLNIKEVSEMYGFAVGTLYRWIQEKKIPYFKINGAVRFSEAGLDRWIAKKEIPAKRVIG